MLTVTGIPCGVDSASSCSRLLQRAACRAVGISCTLKWFMALPTTTSVVPDFEIAPGSSFSSPSAPTSITVWNMRPAFSARLRRPTRSAVRSSGVSRGSS